MDFYAVLAQVMELLQREGRVSYRALKRQFDLDDGYLEDLKVEMIRAKRLAVDEEGDVLVWTGSAALPVTSGPAPDPERAPRSYTPAHLTEKILQARPSLEGERKQVMGDGIMALYGAPLAHEDHAVRACDAALRMPERVTHYGNELQRFRGVPVQIRVGLHSGAVVVRGIDSSLHLDCTAVGQTSHLAARAVGSLAILYHPLRVPAGTGAGGAAPQPGPASPRRSAPPGGPPCAGGHLCVELLLAQVGESQEVQEAEACFQQALAIARRPQAEFWELRAATSLTHLWQQQGKRAEAHALLTPVYGWFTEGFDTADLQEAKALLEELS
jgi:Adenylate and Guanylate cyclase catalytic domain